MCVLLSNLCLVEMEPGRWRGEDAASSTESSASESMIRYPDPAKLPCSNASWPLLSQYLTVRAAPPFYPPLLLADLRLMRCSRPRLRLPFDAPRIFSAVAVPKRQLSYRPINRDLQRLESTTRSPIFAHFSETLDGVPTLRAYNQQVRMWCPC